MTNHDDIERRAYEIYEARGGAHGHDWDDWLQAERELSSGESTKVAGASAPVPHRRRNQLTENKSAASPATV